MTPWDGQPIFEGEVPKPVAARVSRGPSGRLRRVKPSEVVVSRTDLEAVMAFHERDEYEPFVRLRSMLDDSNPALTEGSNDA